MNKEKALALALAVDLHQHASAHPSPEGVISTADKFAQWLGNDVVGLYLQPSQFTYEQGSPVMVITRFRENTVELKDTQQVMVSAHAHDPKGFDTAEAEGVTLTWSTSDPNSVAIQPSDDGLSCLAVAGNPGSGVVLQVTDGTRTGSLAFDVTPGDVSAIVVEAGTPEQQPGL
jgi:hypothetical protein